MSVDLQALLRVALPNVSALLVICALIGSSLAADMTSRTDHPADRHRVLHLAIMCSLGVIVFGLMIRLLISSAWVGDLLSAPSSLAALAVAWLLGSCAFACRLLIGSKAVHSIVLNGSEASKDDLVFRVAAARAVAQLGMTQAPRVVFSSACHAPFVCGVFKPVVLLPQSLSEGSQSDLQLVLTHEFAHIRRGDCLSEFMTQLLGTLCWWNPLFWLAVSRLRSLREEACDRAVVSGLQSRFDYARLLVRFASKAALPLSHAFAHVRMADRASLDTRLDLLLNNPQESRWTLSMWRLSNRQTAYIAAALVMLMMVLDATGVIVAYEVIEMLEAE